MLPEIGDGSSRQTAQGLMRKAGRHPVRLAAVIAVTVSCGFQGTLPVPPEQALETFQIAPGFRIDLFASEPYVIDPVEMVFDEFGGVYVAELLDNPDDPPEGGLPRSRIKYLEDTDSDGVIDRHTVFADRILGVEGIAPWKGGLVATASPDILYLKDLDGDQKADLKEVLYTGFALAHVEGRLSNPRLGLDNWFYVVNNAYPGEITSPGRPGVPPISVRNREFRFHPLLGIAQASAGRAQFGHSYNEWGHWFLSHNTVHLRHTVIPPGYLNRNPLLSVEEAEHDVSDHGRPSAAVFPISEPQQWRIDRTAARQARYDETRPGRVELLEGFFTASCGATVYLGDAFPDGFAGRVFVGEGAGNLVHCDIVTPDGPTYSASRWPEDSDFLASTDSWFRPVNFSNAPDGNLYVLDYYRQYLEHPMFIPDAVKERLRMDFRAGDTLGRIYRITHESAGAGRSLQVSLGALEGSGLVALLEHRNGWHRRTAHRLLVERQELSVVPQLRSLATGSELANSRLHALWVLEGLGAADAALVQQALGDPHPSVRENALRLAEAHLPELSSQVLAATRDSNTRVAFQAALTAGNLPRSGRVVAALGEILARYPEDPWFRIAVLSAPAEFAEPVLDSLLRRRPSFFAEVSSGRQSLVRDLYRLIAARQEAEETGRLLLRLVSRGSLDRPQWKAAALEGLQSGLSLHRGRRLSSPSIGASLEELLGDDSEEVRVAATGIARYVDLGPRVLQAVADALDEGLPAEQRVLAVRTLQGGSFSDVAAPLESLLRGNGDPELRAAAASSLATFDDPSVAASLFDGWASYPPATRDVVADLLIRRRDRALAFADTIATGTIDPLEIPTVTRIRFANHPDGDVRDRVAGRLGLGAGDRDQAVQTHLEVLDLPSDPARGKAPFERECASCHLRRGARGRIGPDLSGVNNRSKETLLTSVLDPSHSVEDRYRNHLLETNDGRFYDGILVTETEASITLRGEVEDVTVLKSDIADLRVSDVSLMPEGLEDALSDQEIADVIAYLRAGL